MVHSTIVGRGGGVPRMIRCPGRLTLVAALCVLALPIDNHWVQQDHLFADDAVQDDEFALSVAISGDTIVVGAHDDDTAAGDRAGSAYVFTRTGDTWGQQGHLFAGDAAAADHFGESVAISSDTIVVGAWANDTAAGIGAGSAYVFTRTGSTWTQQDQLFADDTASGDIFGDSVAIDGDTIAVGAPGDATGVGDNAGSAYVYTRTGGTWSQQDHLFANDAAADDQFGHSVAISGDIIIVGVPLDDTTAGSWTGSAYVFTRSGGTWTQQDHLIADDAELSDHFGKSVAIFGDTAVVGAYKDETDVGFNAGSAYVFAHTSGNWAQRDHLFADDSAAFDEFGSSVAIDGDTIVVGARYDDTAAAAGAGSAYEFTRSGSTWAQQDHLFASDASMSDQFGTSVAISGSRIVVGAPNDGHIPAGRAGSAYVYMRRLLDFFVGEPELSSGH